MLEDLKFNPRLKKENLKSTGNELVEKTESNNPELYNDKFNTELQVGKEGFYIEGKPGETIKLEVMSLKL